MEYFTGRSEELPPDFLLKQTPLPKISEEYGSVEYLVQLSLTSPTAKLLNVWSIGNPHLTIQFEKRTQVILLIQFKMNCSTIIQGILVVDSWLETSLLTEQNTITEISQKGFRIPSSGMAFGTGCAPIRRHPEGLIEIILIF